MKTYDERAEMIYKKIRLGKRRRGLQRAAIALCAVAAIALVLFVPYDTSPPDVSLYKGSDYYSLIQHINLATYEKPRYANNFEAILGTIREEYIANRGETAGPPAAYAPDGDALSGYVEVTDNQVDGVIEGDIFKRSDSHVYHLFQGILTVYDIGMEKTRPVGQYDLAAEPGLQYYGQWQMYLSADCTTVTVVAPCMRTVDKESFVSIRNLDVRDPANIRPSGSFLISGSLLTSRSVDGKLLVMSRHAFPRTGLDFGKESTFVPRMGTPDHLQSIPAEDILCPGQGEYTCYTLVAKLDMQTLEPVGCKALLSYNNEIYVSRDRVYAAMNHRSKENTVTKLQTDISAISYSGDRLEYVGTVTLDGTVKNQYSMDEYEGVLRVVTSTLEREQTYLESLVEVAAPAARRNVNLYCVDIASFEIAAKVEAFAPEGETAESVRFDGPNAYVCTAEVVILSDPVYFFDLSDLNNITWKDTGTIDGYSSSLVDFGDGLLLGIGYGARRNLKIEIYRETETGVESLCAYEPDAWFSEDYKSYYIDRERKLVGLAMEGADSDYVLLQFDGGALRTVLKTSYVGRPGDARAFLEEGWFYILGKELTAHPVF